METRLKPNMYARTQRGQIHKIEELLGNNYYGGVSNNVLDVYGQMLIKKASNNIIDLIEVGDYVNGSCIIDIKSKYEIGKGLKARACFYIREQDIKSIVTKEQFKANEYVVE